MKKERFSSFLAFLEGIYFFIRRRKSGREEEEKGTHPTTRRRIDFVCYSSVLSWKRRFLLKPAHNHCMVRLVPAHRSEDRSSTQMYSPIGLSNVRLGNTKQKEDEKHLLESISQQKDRIL